MSLRSPLRPFVIVAVVSLAAPRGATARIVRDPTLGITFTVPDDCESAPVPPSTRLTNRFACRMARGDHGIGVVVGAEHGMMTERQQLDPRALAAYGANGARFSIEPIRWQSIDLEMVRMSLEQHGRPIVSRIVRLPIRDHAVVLAVGGDRELDAEIASTTQTIVASVRGPVGWAPSRTMHLIEAALSAAIAIGCGVWGWKMWRRNPRVLRRSL